MRIFRNWRWLVGGVVLLTSIVLGLHNATLYAPRHGFDGVGHVYYIEYIAKHWVLPPPTEWETHQAPLYYIIGAILMTLGGSFKFAQYFNTFVLWMIIGVAGLGLRRVYKDKDQVLLGMFALTALPMFNIFPAMVTNELFGTLWSIATGVAMLYLVTEKQSKNIIKYAVAVGLCLAIGAWSKISIITILPTVFIGFVYVFVIQPPWRKQLLFGFLFINVLFTLFSFPIFLRGAKSNGPSNVIQTAGRIKQAPRDIAFYTRLDWIPKVDMYNTQYYSLLGGAWNSFWSDGHNAVTPFVPFHKKAFILWSLGFVLLPISLYGLIRLWEQNRSASVVVYMVGATMLGMYVVYNMISNHYSAVRLTYEMPLVLTYAFGIAGAAHSKKMKMVLFSLLAIQFVVLISFYWILPWWHVTK